MLADVLYCTITLRENSMNNTNVAINAETLCRKVEAELEAMNKRARLFVKLWAIKIYLSAILMGIFALYHNYFGALFMCVYTLAHIALYIICIPKEMR